MTGLKHIDKLIEKFGVDVVADDTPFMRRKRYTHLDAQGCRLPFCFFRIIENLQVGQSVWCFTFHVPDKKQKLACYLVNEKNEIIEQVYFQRDHRSVKACEKLKRMLAKSLSEKMNENYALAA